MEREPVAVHSYNAIRIPPRLESKLRVQRMRLGKRAPSGYGLRNAGPDSS